MTGGEPRKVWYRHPVHGWLPTIPPREREKARRARFKRRLLEQQRGGCHWCGCDIRIYEVGPVGGTNPPDMATWDHLDDRLSPERGKHPGKIRKVLACPKCNHDRGALSCKAVPIERLRELSGRHPREARP